MFIVSPTFTLPTTSPNEPKWYSSENSGVLDTVLTVRNMNELLGESLRFQSHWPGYTMEGTTAQ